MQLSEIKQLMGDQKSLTIEVHSIDPSIYLIFCRQDDKRASLKAANGDNLVFRSRNSAFDALRDIGTSGGAKTLFLPHAPSSVSSLQAGLRSGLMSNLK